MIIEDNFFLKTSYLLRGPLTLSVFILGLFFNSIAFYNLICVASNKRHYEVKAEKAFKNIAENVVNPLVNPPLRSSFRAQVIQPRIYIYFLWLTACDIALLLSALLTYSMPTMFFGFTGLYAYFIPLWYTCSNATFTASVWLVLAFMVERYHTLGRNFKKSVSARASSHLRSFIHKKLFLISLLAFFYALPRFFEISTIYSENLKQHILMKTPLIDNSVYIILYRIIGSLLFYSAVPYIIVLILSLKICSVIKNSRKSFLMTNNSNCSSSKKLRKSGMFLLVISFRFLFSRSVTTIVDLSEYLIGSEKFLNSPIFLFFIDLSNFIVILTSISNFFILFAFSKNFRTHIISFMKLSKNHECL